LFGCPVAGSLVPSSTIQPCDDPSMNDWLTLTQALARTMAAHAPGWTDRNDHDPGITMLEIMAYLADGLRLHRGVVESGSAAAARIVQALDAYDVREPIVVPVNGGKKRPRFFSGRLLTADDFTEEQQYHLAKHRHHLQTLHGSGIVNGLHVTAETDGERITIQPGMAIDGSGREIHLAEEVTLIVPSATQSPAWIMVEYAERIVDPVPVAADGSMEGSRIEEGCDVVIAGVPRESGVAVARLAREQDGWRVDRSYVPARPR
jgi:hypothetical protein